MKRIVAIAVTVMALLALPSVAFAGGSSSCSTYNPQLCQIVGSGNASTGSGASGAATSSASTLPFTGIDVPLLAVGGVALLGAGIGIRRLSAQR